MIPDYVDIDDLVAQAREDNVAIGDVGVAYPEMEQGLMSVVRNAQESGFGTLNIVILDRTPAQPADLRDIAHDVQQGTGANTVIVRSPGTGAVVSEQYSRKALEQAEHTMLGNPDYIASTQTFVDTVPHDVTPWADINIAIGVAVLFTAGWSAWSAWRRRDAATAER